MKSECNSVKSPEVVVIPSLFVICTSRGNIFDGWYGPREKYMYKSAYEANKKLDELKKMQDEYGTFVLPFDLVVVEFRQFRDRGFYRDKNL